MAKRLKRAFTITELVIVIAVVAILAAVLIPTFSNIINKANESADTQTIVSMNHILGADQILNGKPDTMEEAVRVIEEGGYKVENLTPTSDGYEIVWDEENNRLALIDEKGSVVYSEVDLTSNKEKIWKITDKTPANDGYSYYLAPGYSGDNKFTVTAGVDVGENDVIEEITLSLSDEETTEAIIRTAGGCALIVDAAAATVEHYGTAASLQLKAVAEYREFGTITGSFSVSGGAVMLESGSETNTIYVEGAGVVLRWSNDAKPQSVGVSENINLNDVDIQEDAEVNVEGGINSTYKNYFAGGLGTEANPFIIADAAQLQKITEIFDAGYTYFKVQDGVTEIDCSGLQTIEINGRFDGNGVEFVNLTATLFDAYGAESVTIENFAIEDCHIVTDTFGGVVLNNAAMNTVLRDISVGGVLQAATAAPFIAFGPGTDKEGWTCVMENCVSDATLVGTGNCAGFVAHLFQFTNTNWYLVDSYYTGAMYAPQNRTYYFTVNSATGGNLYAHYSGETPAEFSLLTAEPVNVTENGVEYELYENVTLSGIKYTTGIVGTIDLENKEIPANYGDSFTVTAAAGATSAEVRFFVGPNDENGFGNYTTCYKVETLSLQEGQFATEEILYWYITVNGNATQSTGVSGNTFNIVSDSYGTTYTGASVQIIQYDAQGGIVKITNFSWGPNDQTVSL